MMKTSRYGRTRLGLLFCLIGLLSFSAPRVRAQQPDQAPPADQPALSNQPDATDQPAANDANDPPSRVARISFLDGSVSIQPGGAGDWGSAVRNRPMTIGDKLWTDKDSRAELQTGVVSIHLGSMTALSFLNLDQTITQMRLAEGSINFRVKEIRQGDTYEVDTPNLVFTITQAGAFRIDVNENGDNTGITVIRGAGTVTASGKTYDIQPGQRGIFNGTDNVESTIAPQAPPADGLDQWANQRDLGEQNSVSQRYVPDDMPGTQDLDNNGTWSQDGDNGPIWYPAEVSPDWAPYSNGNWSYVAPWGWTWVDYAPWGFAPFHYGRWGFVGSRWGWYPGPRIGVSIYGPAFVGFLGGGFGFGFGAGFGVGWFPLGFGEPFHPWYRGGFGYVNRINVRNTVIRNASVIRSGGSFNYAYAHNTRAVTAASRSAFTGGQAINRGAAHIDEASLRNAQVTNRAGVSPTRQSALGAASARGNVSRPPSSVENRSVMARTTPGAGATNSPVHTMSTNGLSAGHANNGGTTARQNELSGSRPSSAGANNSRSWSAQGNTTDHGQAPNGFGRSNSSSDSTMSARANNRPPWAGSGASATGGNNAAGSRSYAPAGNAAANNANNRGNTPQTRTNPPATRTYSAPSRSYGGSSAPHASSGGAAPHGGGGSAPHGGGGGGSHGHR
jgi:uncharacterized protein DUF6600/FecR-like protein